MSKKRKILRQYSQEKEKDLQPREVNCPSSKRFRIITVGEEYKWNLPQDMVNYANENSDKYIPAKEFKEAILIKTNENSTDKKSKCRSQRKFATFYLDRGSQLLHNIYQGTSI